MPAASFLDTGVVLGFCFRDDSHHHRCRRYLERNDFALFLSDHVVSELLNREPNLAEEIADGIFEHIDRLRGAGFDGELDATDRSRIRQNHIGDDNEAGDTLYGFYRRLSGRIPFADLTERLRDLARDIEQNAIENREGLMERVEEVWERGEEYGDVDDALSAIPEDDRRICLDAHDVAEVTEQTTELATTNPTDLVEDGYRALILEETSVEDVVSVANRP
jgi:hypothetical protein